LAVAVAFQPAWRVAPVTAIMLLLTPLSQAMGPVSAAMQRMMEVGLGSLVAVSVALALAPRRARVNLSEAAQSALELLASLTTTLMAGLTVTRLPSAVEGLHAELRASIGRAETAAAEARRERIVAITPTFDPLPFCRALRRAHHDLVMLGRLTLSPLPPEASVAMARPGAAVGEAVSACFRSQALALGRRAPPPPAGLVFATIEMFTGAIAELRASGTTRSISDDGLARLFGLAFVIEQLGQDLAQMTERIAELADHP
jgi:hypothetical protein